MEKVEFSEVGNVFNEIWCGSAESLFHEIAWDCLDQAGMTTYENEKTHALIHVYAYVIQMLVDEFSYVAYDEYCSYDYEVYDEPLTDAAIGWLYRDLLEQEQVVDTESFFMCDANMMLRELVFRLRHKVADVIFNQFGAYEIGKLLFFAIRGNPLAEEYDEELEEESDDPEMFKTKEELIQYAQTVDIDLYYALDNSNGMKLLHWLECHSCSLDD